MKLLRVLNYSLTVGFILVGSISSCPVHAQSFSVNADRFDPYKNFKFKVKWDDRYAPGVAYVSPLRRSTEVISHRAGGDSNSVRKSPGTTRFAPITIRRGVTHDTEFEKWANKVWNYGSRFGAEVSLKDFRKDVIVELYNESGQLVRAYKVFRCWPSNYQAMSELDANGNATLIESLQLEHEGWERDYDVGEPTEESFTEPAS